MTVLNEPIPEATPYLRAELRRMVRTAAYERDKDPGEATAEAYRLWLEAERDRRELEGGST
jgi:hypothetical protein